MMQREKKRQKVVIDIRHVKPLILLSARQAGAMQQLQERPAALAGEQWEALGQRLRLLEQGVQARPCARSGLVLPRVLWGKQCVNPHDGGLEALCECSCMHSVRADAPLLQQRA